MLFSKFRLTSLFTFALCAGLLLTSNVEAQKVHALLVIMDTGKGRKSFQIDGKLMEGLLDEIEQVYPTSVKMLSSSAGETTPSNIRKEIRELHPGPDDVVLFYFSGHGGMVSKGETYLLVTDPVPSDSDDPLIEMFRSDIEQEISDHNCRLKLIITDCCSSVEQTGARNRKYVTFYNTRKRQKTAIRNLFGEHEGLLHVNGATEGQYGWGTNNGGIFTEPLILTIHEQSDQNDDGFVDWTEVLATTEKLTGIRWDRLFPDPEAAKREHGVQNTRQVPKVYETPKRSDGQPTELTTGLWSLGNSYSDSIDVSVATHQKSYSLDDVAVFKIRPEKNCYLILLSWDSSGNLTQLFPNKFDRNNRLEARKRYTVPPAGADYEFFVTKKGTERLKALVFADRSTSDRITKVFDDSKGSFRNQKIRDDSKSVIPRYELGEVNKLVSKEKKISEILKDLHSDEWGENRVETTVK